MLRQVTYTCAGRRHTTLLHCIAACIAITAPPVSTQPLDHDQLLVARASGNTRLQREHSWQTFLKLATPTGSASSPVFTRWHSEAETFHPSPAPATGRFPGSPVTTRADATMSATTLAGGPLITFIHFNDAAHAHIRANALHERATLDRLLAATETGGGARRVPPLPPEAVVAMTAWWPVDGRHPTPMPVWDPERQARVQGANGYLSWPRTLAVISVPEQGVRDVASVAFAGRRVENPAAVSIERFFYIPVDAQMAQQLMVNARFRNAAAIALGRPLAAGDFIALVGLHLMTAELDTGVWATFWWHDQPDAGPFAAGRPESLPTPWDHYLMDVTLDARQPLEPDGSPNICFNPWFDATFPDTGEGSGVQANCVSCHERAGHPVTRAMRVTRGAPPNADAPARLQTGLLWSIAKTGRIQSPPADP